MSPQQAKNPGRRNQLVDLQRSSHKNTPSPLFQTVSHPKRHRRRQQQQRHHGARNLPLDSGGRASRSRGQPDRSAGAPTAAARRGEKCGATHCPRRTGTRRRRRPLSRGGTWGGRRQALDHDDLGASVQGRARRRVLPGALHSALRRGRRRAAAGDGGKKSRNGVRPVCSCACPVGFPWNSYRTTYILAQGRVLLQRYQFVFPVGDRTYCIPSPESWECWHSKRLWLCAWCWDGLKLQDHVGLDAWSASGTPCTEARYPRRRTETSKECWSVAPSQSTIRAAPLLAWKWPSISGSCRRHVDTKPARIESQRQFENKTLLSISTFFDEISSSAPLLVGPLGIPQSLRRRQSI